MTDDDDRTLHFADNLSDEGIFEYEIKYDYISDNIEIWYASQSENDEFDNINARFDYESDIKFIKQFTVDINERDKT
jgi:hypothetical protein